MKKYMVLMYGLLPEIVEADYFVIEEKKVLVFKVEGRTVASFIIWNGVKEINK
jgi:hypothetical protein